MALSSFFRRTGSAPAAVPFSKSTVVVPSGPAGRTISAVDTVALVDHHCDLLETLRSAATLTKEEFAELVLPTVRNLAEHLQLLPSSEQEHHSDLGGGLRHSIEVALSAVRLSYSRDLTGRARERRSSLEQCMRITLIMASLLHDVGKPVTDVEVWGDTKDGRAQWCPFVESLTAWITRHGLSEFEVDWVPGRMKRHEAFTGMFGLRLLDARVLEFIGEQGGMMALNQLWEGAIGNLDGHSLIKDLVKDADRETSLADLKASRGVRRGAEEGHRADRLIGIIRENVLSGKWRFNEPGGWIWHLDRGLFLSWPVACMHISAELGEREEKGYPSDPDVILDWLIGRGLANRFFSPNEGNRKVWPFAPLILRTRTGVATLLSGVRIADVEMVFGDTPPTTVDRDLYSDIVSGRIQHTGAKLPAGVQTAVSVPAVAASKAATSANKSTGATPPELEASEVIERVPPPPGPPEASSQSPPDAIRAPAESEAGAEAATAWLTAEASKGRLIVREMMHRLVSPKDKALRWGDNAQLWRDRLAMAWPDAVDGLGMDPKGALQGLIEHGVLHQETMRGADGFVHRISLGGVLREAVAFREPITQLLMPLVETYVVKGGQAQGQSSAAGHDVSSAPDQPKGTRRSKARKSVGGEAADSSPLPVQESADPFQDTPPAVDPKPAPAHASKVGDQDALQPVGKHDRAEQVSEPMSPAEVASAVPVIAPEDLERATAFLAWLAQRQAIDQPFDDHTLIKAFADETGCKLRTLRRALTAGVCPLLRAAAEGLSVLNPEHPAALQGTVA